MKQYLNARNLFWRFMLLLPLIYVAFGWYMGLNYGRKGVIFGPYLDILVVMKTRLLGSSLEEISGSKVLVMVSPVEGAGKPDQDSTYFNTTGYFELPGT